MENIMLDTPKRNIKLVDFGLSNTFYKDELMKTHCGSPEYAAPELFTAGDKYGLEIDVWSLGIVMYAMLVGKLPFTTPYTDQYRRQKLVQQMEKGLVEIHNQEMGHLSADGQDLLHKLIEPCPSLRLPLLDMEIHPWVTENAKKQFFPFQSFPRDKAMKTQMKKSVFVNRDGFCQLQDSMSSLEEDETLEELAVALSMKKEVLEQKVAENKSDELSAMFNMILDRKRQQQGVFEVDHTIKNAEKKETKGRRSKSAHAKIEKGGDKRQFSKALPALVLPSDDTAADSAHYTGNDQEHDTKFSTFDFLALCSTPTWLGPERRKSRRRSRSPMPSPHIQQHGSQGLSVRNQMKRDFMERQAMEMEREILREEKAAAAGLLSPGHQPNNHNDYHVPVSTSLSIPGNDPAASHQLAICRSSSFKLSRRRARSCSSSHRRRGSYQRSCSIDLHTPDVGEAPNFSDRLHSTKDGRSAPMISDDSVIVRGGKKASSLKIRRHSILGPNNVTATRKRSVDFVDTANKNFLGVPNFDMHAQNPLSALSVEPQKSLLRVPQVDLDGRSLLQVPNYDMDSHPRVSVPHIHDGMALQTEDRLALTNGSKLQSVTRPGRLTLKECYSPPKDEKNKPSSYLLPMIKPLVSGANGPLANVEVHHYVDSSNPNSYPSSSTDLLHPSSHDLLKRDPLDVPQANMESLNDSHNSGPEIRDKQGHGDSSFEDLLDTWGRKKFEKTPQRFSLLETSSTSFSSHIIPPPAHVSNHLKISCRLGEGAVAMQIEDKSNVLCNSSEDRLLLGAEGPLIHCDVSSKDGLTDLQDHFHELIISSECLEENEDRVDSMTKLISDSFREEVLANTKLNDSITPGSGATQKVNRRNSTPTPDEDLAQNRAFARRGSGSLASFSRSSGSGRRSGGGKVKSPITPTWLNLKTPLARIESFHSDDFECFANSDNDEQGSVSPMSVTTPTVPCFAYKLHVMKKKQTKLKDGGSTKNNRCRSTQNSDYTSSKLSHNAVDKKHASVSSTHVRLDAAVIEPLLSSGDETEHHDEGQERFGTPGKSKIHPMEADDRDAELLSKSDTKCLPYHNAITRQPNQVKNSTKFPKIIPEDEQGAKKKVFVKNLAWRKSFAQFLKRKRYHSPVATSSPQQHQQQIHQHQQQQTAPGNNNNNDFARTEPVPESRNGISALGQPQTKVMDTSAGTEDLLVTSQEGESIKVVTTAVPPVPVENCVTELIELQSSPKLHCSSSPTRVFDFSLATDSPRMKSSCLLGWGTCRDCGKGDISSEEDVECFTTVDMTAVGLNLKPIGENSVPESINFSQSYQLSPT